MKMMIINLLMLMSIHFVMANKVTGTIKYEDELIRNCEVILYMNNSIESITKSNKQGKFHIKIHPDRYYTLEFNKEGFVSKRVVIKTKDMHLVSHPLQFNVTLNPSISYNSEIYHKHDLEFPFGLIQFNARKKCFEYLEEYTERMKYLEKLALDTSKAVKVKIRGLVTSEDTTVNNAQVFALYDENAVIQMQTDQFGKFIAELDGGKLYTLLVNKVGYSPKLYTVDTKKAVLRTRPVDIKTNIDIKPGLNSQKIEKIAQLVDLMNR